MRYFKEIIIKNKYWIIFYLAVRLNSSFMSGFCPSLFQHVIDGFSDGTLTMGLLLGYGAVLLWCVLTSYLGQWPQNKLDNGIQLDFKLFALQKISRMDYDTYRAMGTGKVMQRIENGAASGKNILFNFWFELFGGLLPTIFFSLLFIWRISPQITCVILIGYIGVFIVTNLLLKMLYKIKERILEHEEQLNHFFVRGFMEMLVFRMERQFPLEIRKASHAKNEIVNLKTKMSMIHEAFFVIFAVFVKLLEIFILIYAYHSKTVSIGETLALITLVDRAYSPIAVFNVLFVQYKLDKAAYKRFEEFLNSPDDPQLTIGVKANVNGDIRVQNLSFSYGERVIFEDLNLNIHQGEKVAFVGESGSGKTTLLRILSGLTKYENGSVCINGQELKTLCLDSFYEQLFYISQDSPVFDGTLRENLVFGRETPDDDLWAALNDVQLSFTAKKLPDGLNTSIGERGASLSGGEKQRLALARLCFVHRPIIMLDEATSAMDNLTEQAVMQTILHESKDSTLIAVSHRLSAIADFDRIVVFHRGEIVGEGTFEMLMQNNTYFQELYDAEAEA